jgi:protocatechuate 3,4-dioxygenase, alpha subunit
MPADLFNVAPVLAHHPEGQPVRLSGRFLDSNGDGVPSLVIEVWQANAHGRYRHPLDYSDRPLDPQFGGFARLRTDDAGRFALSTIKPGPHATSPGSRILRAPHLRLTIFASGIDRLVTQVFFDDEPLNETDPVLTCIPDPARRSRLVARGSGNSEYCLDIVLRGAVETPFFDDWAE